VKRPEVILPKSSPSLLSIRAGCSESELAASQRDIFEMRAIRICAAAFGPCLTVAMGFDVIEPAKAEALVGDTREVAVSAPGAIHPRMEMMVKVAD
jgi:hypothetical protein